MKIKGIEGLSMNEINKEVSQGAKFVYFPYCISLLVVTLRRSSDIHFVRSTESAIKHGWPNLVISFFAGWWGLPWGPIYTIQSIAKSFTGNDVTTDVVNQLRFNHAVDNAAPVNTAPQAGNTSDWGAYNQNQQQN